MNDRLIPLLLLLLAALLAPTRASAEPEFRRVDFDPIGSLEQRLLDDLDGDGRSELILVSGRRFVVHRGGPGFGGEAETAFTFDPDGLMFCIGDVDDDPRTREVLYLARGGLWYYAVGADGHLDPTPKKLLEIEGGLVTTGQRDNVHWRRLLADLDGDGRHDVVFPTEEGYRILFAAPEDAEGPRYDLERSSLVPYTITRRLDVTEHGLLDHTTHERGIPDWTDGDFDGDGRTDFVLKPPGRLEVHRGGEEGFSAEADFWIDVSEVKGALGLVPLTIADVNGNGRSDFMANEPWRGRTTIFLGREIAERGRVELPEPAVIRKVSGWSWEPRLIDLDGDGRLDLVLPTTERVGAGEALKVLLAGTVGVRTFLFLNTGNPARPFRDEPTAVRTIDVEIRISMDFTGRVDIGHAVLANYDGDFDGDGRRDLLLKTSRTELSIFPGVEKGVLADRASRTLPIPSAAEVRHVSSEVRDADGDGVPDIFLYYRSWDGRSDRALALLTRKE